MTEMKRITVDEEEFANLAICAIRYCHGRQTYMPKVIQGIVIDHLKDFSDKDMHVLLDDCDFQMRFQLMGDMMVDLPNWISYRDKLVEEFKSRGLEPYTHWTFYDKYEW